MNTSELHVVFGTGPLGHATIQALVEQGYRVRAVNRSGTMPQAPVGVELVAADVYTPAQAVDAAKGAAVVYQCAQPGYTEWVSKFPPLQTNILQAAAQHGAKFIVGDNLYMYGEVEGKIHEGLPYAASNRKGTVRAQMAQAVLDAHQKGTVRAALGRGSDFFGPYVLGSSLGERAFYPMLEGKAAEAYGNIDLPHSYTYIKDFGRALATLGTDDRALGRVWHVPTPPALTQRELLTRAFGIAGHAPKISTMGGLMLRLGGLFIPVAREMIEMMYEYQKPFVVDDSAFVQTFGWQATPIDDALRETLTWFKTHPQAQAH